MQNYVLTIDSEVSTSYRCQRAADSLDIDASKKSRHHFSVSADLETPFHIGLIVGASGSGKTTLAKKIFGATCFDFELDQSKAVIDQFPKEMSYDECAAALSGMGLTSVPCWIRPIYTLSNGQKARAEAALRMAHNQDGVIAIDEWTSVVDRTVGKVMSHCVAKHARKTGKRIVLMSCHYDVAEWLNPDWVIDCNKQEYTDRRAMVGAFKRADQLRLDIREVDRKTWPYFSKYHYLSARLPGGKIYTFGLYNGEDQIGFQCFAAYIIGDHKTFFSNRTVIHPDYAGLGMGIKLISETSKIMIQRGFRIKAKFSSIPVYKAMQRDPNWKCTSIDKPIKTPRLGKNAGCGIQRENHFRTKTTTFHFDFIWKPPTPQISSP